MRQVLGAGEGNRTPVFSLESYSNSHYTTPAQLFACKLYSTHEDISTSIFHNGKRNTITTCMQPQIRDAKSPTFLSI